MWWVGSTTKVSMQNNWMIWGRASVYHKLMKMKTVEQYDFSGKRALIRVDFNVPLNEQFEITDDNRIVAAFPTIEKILNDGGAVVLMSHLGRPKGQASDKFSLKHIVANLSKKLR